MKVRCPHCGKDVPCRSFQVVAQCPQCGMLLDEPGLARNASAAAGGQCQAPGRRLRIVFPIKFLGGLLILLLTFGTADVVQWMRDPVGLRIWVALLYGRAWLVLAEGIVLLIGAAALAVLLVREIRRCTALRREILGVFFIAAGAAEVILGLNSKGLMAPWRGNPSPLLVSGLLLVMGGIALMLVNPKAAQAAGQGM